MPDCRKTLARRAAVFAVSAACLVSLGGTAVALDAPGDLRSKPASPSQSTAWAFTWTAPAADPGYQVSGYEVSVDRGAFVAGSPPFVTGLAEGVHTIQVRAIETFIPVDPAPDPAPGPVTGPPASIAVRVDHTAPTIRATLNPASPNGLNGWYRTLRVEFACADSGSGVASCPAADTIGDRGAADQGANQTRSGTASDRVGLTATGTSPRFNFDGIGPRTGEPKVPTPNARIAAEPVFTWSSGGDATSGAQRYDLLVRWSGRAEFVAASVPHAIRQSAFSSARTSGPALPEGVSIDWRVRTYDVAGNSTTSFSRTFVIDSTVPPAPAITGGPAGFTNHNAPTFTWTGNLSSYAWSVSLAGALTPVQTGQGGGTSVTLAALPDGDYTFQVTQSSTAGVPSDEATRSFQVDTVAPPAPTITSRPSFPTAVPAPSFSWTAEEGASFRWQVIGSGGSSLQGPTDTPLPGATIAAVPSGAYSFRVWQIDPAGNVSPATSEPFAVVGASAASQRPAARSAPLPRLNAGKLSPRAGTVVKTRSPLLRWKTGRKGTTLYNLQLFRVISRPPGKASIVRKVFTAFPKKASFRLPAAKVVAGSCYVWRIWPYLGTKFAPKPLGISNFCVAKASVLRKAKRSTTRRSSARVH